MFCLNFFINLLLLLKLIESLSTNVQIKTNNVIKTNSFQYLNEKLGTQKIRYNVVKHSFLSKFAPKKGNVLCVHGFGGNADQWRKNIPVLANEGYDSYAIDLLGYGYSDKPNPKQYKVNEIYNFETWSDQCVSFIENVIKEPTYIVCNSVGCIAGLCATIDRPDLVKGIVLIDMSLRLLHVRNQNPLQRPFVSAFQTLLRETNVGKYFFKQIAQPKAIKNILNQAYANYGVDDEIVDIILKPGLEPGAVEVFLDFISYSGGPLPEDLLPQVTRPVRILWGELDPWEPIKLGRKYEKYSCVDEFVTLKGGGHCPMDQIPDQVNYEILRFLK